MRRMILKRPAVTLCILVLYAAGAMAYDFEVDGVYYNYESAGGRTCAVTCGDAPYAGVVDIPAEVTVDGDRLTVVKILEKAFSRCTELAEVAIPSTVEEIGLYSFGGCTALKSVVIPQSVRTVCGYAFAGSGVDSVTVEDGAEPLLVEFGAFDNTMLRYAYLGRDIDYDPLYNSSAFSGITTLGEIVLGGSVTRLGRRMFEGCSSLKEIDVPSSVSEIGDGAFSYCSSLERISLPPELETVSRDMLAYCTALKSVDIPRTVSHVGDMAFFDCDGLTEIVVPESVEAMGRSVFAGCDGLKSVSLSCALTEIAYGTFSSCTGLETVCLPPSVETIGSLAFSNCTSLKSVSLPSSVRTIGSNAFEGCRGMTEFTVPSATESIGNGAFNSCYSLCSLTIEDGRAALLLGSYNYNNFSGMFKDCPIETLYLGRGIAYTFDHDGNSAAFSAVYSLKTVVIGSEVTDIGTGTFTRCTGLNAIKSLAAVPPASAAVAGFTAGQYASIGLTVPAGALDAYKTADGWRNFTKISEAAPTGMHAQVSSAGLRITAAEGVIVIEGCEGAATVYAASGKPVGTACARDGRTEISVEAHGVYIIKANGVVRKVAL